VFRAICRDRLLNLCPLGDEIGEDLRLDSWSASEFYGVSAKLYCPFNDAAIRILVAENITEWEFGDDSDLVGFKIMAELAGCN
jgi:hypothetical protein